MKLELIFCCVLIFMLFVEYCVELWMDSSIYNANFNYSVIYQPVVLPSLLINNSVIKDDSEIHDRPLFSEDRKPQKKAPVAFDTSIPDIGALDDWLLIGVYNHNHQMSALFRNRNEEKKYLKLSENQTIAGWLIKEIKPTHVLLELSGQEKQLELITLKTKLKPSADYDPYLKH